MKTCDYTQTIRTHYKPKRIAEVDADFLAFEEEHANREDLALITKCLQEGTVQFKSNPYNSILLYVTGLTNEFDHKMGRSHTIDGAPPDVDMDMSAASRPAVLSWLTEEWGEEHVANIGTVGQFKPKSISRRYFKMVEDKGPLMADVLGKIPPPLFGREPTLEEIVEGNDEKGYPAHPELRTDQKYAGWYEFASKIEGMVANRGVHAAGVVVSDEPVSNHIPIWKNRDYARITEFDMKEVEDLGALKFDFLVINNGDIIQMCVELIEQRRGIRIDTDNIPDGDSKAYSLMGRGLLSGVFQFETSRAIKEATQKARPKQVPDLAAISSAVRPGPASAGFLKRYLDDEADPDVPEPIRKLWSNSRGVLLYQEQLMEMFVQFCGYDPQEADTIRRIVGKKKPEQLAPLEPDFMERFQKHGGFTQEQAEYMWHVIMGCADYLFNLSHACLYSYTSYVCAYLKANYPLEFFTALMTVRSQVMQPKLWASKAPEYIQEARQMGIHVLPPSVQHSGLEFTISKDRIYFGLNGIRGVGKGAARAIVKLRKDGFRDILDFAMRANAKINSGTIEALAHAGAFDSMGYRRQEIIDVVGDLFDYKRNLVDYYTRLETNRQREKENEEIQNLLDRRNELRGIQRRKKDRDLFEDEKTFLEETKGLRLHRILKAKKPEAPEVQRYPKVPITITQVIKQAEYIGCFLGRHPVRSLWPQAVPIDRAYVGCRAPIAGQISNRKDIVTRKSKQPMCFLEITDGTSIAEITVFPRVFAKLQSTGQLPEVGDLALIYGRVESEDPSIKMIVNTITVHRNNE